MNKSTNKNNKAQYTQIAKIVPELQQTKPPAGSTIVLRPSSVASASLPAFLLCRFYLQPHSTLTPPLCATTPTSLCYSALTSLCNVTPTLLSASFTIMSSSLPFKLIYDLCNLKTCFYYLYYLKF